MALAYAVLFGIGCGAMGKQVAGLYRQPLVPRIAMATFLLIPLAWTPTMLGSMYGQLRPRMYPSEWYSVNQLLSKDPEHFQVLFLPWHGYQYFDFAGRIIASPADRFFDKPTIVSNELEFRGASPTFPDAIKSYITHSVLPQAPNRQDLGFKLGKIGVKYIVMYGNDQDYNYVAKQPEFQLVYNTSSLKVYKNKAYEG